MKYYFVLILFVLAACASVLPVAVEEENVALLNTSEIPGCINGSPNWVGQRDMSEHSRYDPPFEVTQPSREELIKENPNVIFINISDLPEGDNVPSGHVSFNSDGTFSVTRSPANVTPTPTTPIPPGIDPWHSLLGRHPNVEDNAEIMDYINTCGLSRWYEKRYNATCRYVYLIPGPSCSQKLVYLNKDVNEREDDESIIWVRLIDLNEELPVEVPDPLAGFYFMYLEARENLAIEAFVKEYGPERWGEVMENGTAVQVYLVAEDKTFRQLVATLEGTAITEVTFLDENALAVNKTEALARAREQVSSSAECTDIHLKLEENRAVWFVSYMDGPVFMVSEVDAGEVPASAKKVPGFSSVSALGSLLLLQGIRRRREGQRS